MPWLGLRTTGQVDRPTQIVEPVACPTSVERALQNNSKIVVPTGSDLVNVIGDIAGMLPLTRSQPSQNGHERRATSAGGMRDA